MMSQNRLSAVDRRNAESDYRINVKADLDSLCEQEILKVMGIIERLLEHLVGHQAGARDFGSPWFRSSREGLRMPDPIREIGYKRSGR